MKILSKITLFLCLLFFSSITAQNTSNVLPVLQLPQQTKDSIQLHPYMQVCVDSASRMSLQEAQKQHFIPLSKLPVAKIASTRFNYWYFFIVENPLPDTVKLSLSFMEIYSLTVFTVQEQRLLDSVTVGKLIRPHPQPEKTFYPSNRTLLLYFPPKKQVTVWLKAKKSWCQIQEQPILYNPSVEASFHYKTLLGVYTWNFIFLGVLLFMMIHALTHYFLQKQTAFLYYFFYILSHFAFYWWVFDYQDQFLNILPVSILNDDYRVIIGTCWSFFYILFLDSFFDAKRKMPQLHWWLNIAMLSFWGLIVIDFLIFKIDKMLVDSVIGKAKYFLNILSLILVLYIMWVFRKSPLANYILIGTFLFVLGSLYIRIVPETSLYWEDDLIGQQIGILLELIFFSIGLAYKSRLDTIEKERLSIKNQQLSHENALNTLEKERLTLEIALKETQIRTEVALDIHDKVGAELSKMSLTAQNDSNLPDAQVPFLKDRIRYYGNEARLLSNKMREIIFAIDPEYNNFEDMQAYFREQAREFWANLNVEVVYDFDSDTVEERNPDSFGKGGDAVTVSTNLKRHLLPIFTEAQNNAAKYAQTKKIYLTFKLINPNQYVLEIKDEGIGFDIHKINHVHSKTKGVSGIKHRAEMIHAVCSIDSVAGRGTVIRVVGDVKTVKNEG